MVIEFSWKQASISYSIRYLYAEKLRTNLRSIPTCTSIPPRKFPRLQAVLNSADSRTVGRTSLLQKINKQQKSPVSDNGSPSSIMTKTLKTKQTGTYSIPRGVKADENGNVSIKEEIFVKMKTNVLSYRQTIVDFDKANGKVDTLTQKVTDLEDQLGNANTDKEKTKEKDQKIIKDLTKKNAEYRVLLKTKGIVLDDEINKDIAKQVQDYVKDHLYRTRKFYRKDTEVKTDLKKAYTAIPADLKTLELVTLPEFQRIYSFTLEKQVKDCRQSTQATLKNKAFGTYFIPYFGNDISVNLPKFLFSLTTNFFSFTVFLKQNPGENFPTCAGILDLLARDPATIEKDSWDYKVLLWYFDCYLAGASGVFWDFDIRNYDFYGDPLEFQGKKLPVNVTIATEAMALLLLENGHEKWPKMFKWKEDNPGKNTPKDKEYDGKLTTSKQGQVKFGGWSDVGMDLFNKLQKQVQDLRVNDRDNNDRVFAKYIREILRDTSGCICDTPALEKIRKDNSDSGNKSRKNKKRKLAALDEGPEILLFDEEE